MEAVMENKIRELKGKPTLNLVKEDETAFINARTYWSLTYTAGDVEPDRSYELRIKHQYPEDIITRFVWEDGDAKEAMTSDQFQEWCADVQEHEPERDLDEIRDTLFDRVAILDEYRMTTFLMLERWWQAIVLLVNPRVNW